MPIECLEQLYWALERAISSFSLRLMLVTNDLRVRGLFTLIIDSFFPRGFDTQAVCHKNFTIVINSLNTSFIANNSRWQQAYKLASYGDREWTVPHVLTNDQIKPRTRLVEKPADIIDSNSVTI